MKSPIQCPSCRGDAFNKYGRTKGGKQRYLCLVCGRQFVRDGPRHDMKNRPRCPLCGGKMHIYVTGEHVTRYRCSHYPSCRGFAKVPIEGEPHCPNPIQNQD